jgi:putative endonuclease
MVRTKNDRLYIGISNDVPRRFSEHVAGGKKAARFLRGKSPLRLVYQQKIGSRSEALKVEAAVKKLPKAKKEDLIKGRCSLRKVIICSVFEN